MERCFDYTGSVNRLGAVINGVPTAAELAALALISLASNQLDIAEYLIVPELKPDVEQINFVNLQVCLEDAWLSASGSKILIKGVIKQNIMYTACGGDQSVHTVEKEFPFSHFIDVLGIIIPPIILQNVAQNIVLAPEDAFVEMQNGRKIFKNIIIAAYLINPLLT